MRVSVLVGKALVLGGGLAFFSRSTLRPFGPELKAEGLSTGQRPRCLRIFFYDFLFFYDAYDLHDPRAFGTCERIDLPGSSPGQAAIFWMRRAQLFLNSSDEPFGSRIEGIKRS